MLTLSGVENGGVQIVEINTWVEIAGYSVFDDTTATAELHSYVAVFDPNYIQVTLENGKFVADKMGDYKICYYCYDAEGNCTSARYTVRVK